MSKHSPGPWRWDDGGLVDGDGKYLAIASAPDAVPANARLIAAAPEMYEMLRDCVLNGSAYNLERLTALLARIDGEWEKPDGG